MPNLANMTVEQTQAAIRKEAIAQQNDRFRRAICGKLDHPEDKGLRVPNGRLVWTQGINALGSVFLADALEAVAKFDAFGEDNDPYGTREFAALEISHEGQAVKIYWKIDCYSDQSFNYGSEDPADMDKTCRVLTLLLPSEY